MDKEREAVLKHNLGARVCWRSRQTGQLVTLYDGELAQMDTFSGRWQTVCEKHGTIISHETYKLALSHLAVPLEWCELCRDGACSKCGINPCEPSSDICWQCVFEDKVIQCGGCGRILAIGNGIVAHIGDQFKRFCGIACIQRRYGDLVEWGGRFPTVSKRVMQGKDRRRYIDELIRTTPELKIQIEGWTIDEWKLRGMPKSHRLRDAGGWFLTTYETARCQICLKDRRDEEWDGGPVCKECMSKPFIVPKYQREDFEFETCAECHKPLARFELGVCLDCQHIDVRLGTA